MTEEQYVSDTEPAVHLLSEMATAENAAAAADPAGLENGEFDDRSTHDEYTLAKNIIVLSVARTWDEAKLEWNLISVFKQPQSGKCLCGHHPITEHCAIRNRINGNIAIVGNCCVKNFLGIRADKIFDAIERIKKDSTRSLNGETIEYAYKQRWINDYEREFYFNTMHKKKTGYKNLLSPKQLSKRVQINRKVLHCFQSTQLKDSALLQYPV